MERPEQQTMGETDDLTEEQTATKFPWSGHSRAISVRWLVYPWINLADHLMTDVAMVYTVKDLCRQIATSIVKSDLSQRAPMQLSCAMGVVKPLSLFV